MAPRSGLRGACRPATKIARLLPLDTARLRFSTMSSDDTEAMTELLGDPIVMAFYPAPKSRADAVKWILRNEHNYAAHGFGLWIVETHAGEFVGDCGLTWQTVSGVPRLEVGYHVLPAWQGLGLATKAAAACRDLARDLLEADELVAIVHPDNRASLRVAEKLGMRRIAEDHDGDIPVRVVLGMRLDR
ncbi:GNAT family N-acetyltransferase [uncultured Microbacterium sp.]|uniref:GNAT family N-acetyltransferase n=1 Tax=uncultured Microbacterium sp. TaxID=191216 RepID=UPI00344633C2